MSARSKPKTHAPLGNVGETICGSNSVFAIWRCADCGKCANRLDAILELLMDAAEGVDIQNKARKLVDKLRIKRNDEDSKAR